MQPNEHDAISERLLARLEEIQTALAEVQHDNPGRRNLERQERAVRHEFAAHLMVDGARTMDCTRPRARGMYRKSGTTVRPLWRVGGVPRKKEKAAASEWMRARGLCWDGSAPHLQREIQVALDRNESVPHGHFGLHVEWTVEIGVVEWLQIGSASSFHIVPGQVHYS